MNTLIMWWFLSSIVRNIWMMTKNQVVKKKVIGEELNSSFGNWKVCARFVPHQLSEHQKIALLVNRKDIILTAENNLDFLVWRQSAELKFKGRPKKKKLIFRSAVWRQCTSRSVILRVFSTRNLFEKDKLLMVNTIYKFYTVCGHEFVTWQKP